MRIVIVATGLKYLGATMEQITDHLDLLPRRITRNESDIHTLKAQYTLIMERTEKIRPAYDQHAPNEEWEPLKQKTIMALPDAFPEMRVTSISSRPSAPS